MPLTLHSSALYSGLFGDDEVASLLDDASEVDEMVRVEASLARVQAELSVIPADAGAELARILGDVRLEPAVLADGVASSGVPVPALVAELRKAVGSELGQWLHWGATSQDILDCAHVLQYRAALDVLAKRLGRTIDALERQSNEHQNLVFAARTRSQVATPISFGLRIAQWAAPLIEAEAELAHVQKRLCRVQFGGASGANTAVAPHGSAIARGLAQALGLAPSPPWHTNRAGIHAVTGWLSEICTGLSKFSGDLILMGRSESREARAGVGGGSSTMPQKANPVAAEAIQTLGYICHAARAGLSTAHAEERDGIPWTLEWTLVPQMLMATGAALRHAVELSETLAANPDAMAKTMGLNPDVWAESVSFALAKDMPRVEAQALVKKASTDDAPFAEALSKYAGDSVDLNAAFDMRLIVDSSKATVADIFARRKS